MHNHHGQMTELFPPIDPPQQDASGVVTNQATRLAQLEQSCYQCHPGTTTKCLRGAMFNGNMLCSDCHGSMLQVGDDFSRDVSPQTPGVFVLNLGNFYTPGSAQPRVPWANEPGCGSCHTGTASNNLFTTTVNRVVTFGDTSTLIVNTKDKNGVTDNVRLRQAFHIDDGKATPIVPANKTFAEPAVPATFGAAPNTFANPGAGNPKLYRVSTGHGGVMCEGCHGATHAEWPNANPNANDNVTANQLQGHSGVLMECSACHVTANLPARTQGGPHGMHLVNDSRWRSSTNHGEAAHSENSKSDRGTCGACHGVDHKGTVLSRTPVARNYGSGRTVAAGQPVPCDLCHSLSKSFGT